MRRGKQIGRSACFVVIGIGLAMCLAGATKAHAGEVVITAMGRTKFWVTGRITEFAIRQFELGDIPAAGCPDTLVEVPHTQELVVRAEGPCGPGEWQNPPAPGVSHYVVDVGVSFFLNGQDIGHSARLQGRGNLEFTIRLEAELTNCEGRPSSVRRTWDRSFIVKSVAFLKIEGDTKGVCKGSKATFTVTTDPEDGVEYVDGGSYYDGALVRNGNTFTTAGPCNTPGYYTMTFNLTANGQQCARRDLWDFKVIEMKELPSLTLCKRSSAPLSATTNPSRRPLKWRIVGETHGCRIDQDEGDWEAEGAMFVAGDQDATVTIEAQDEEIGCSLTGTVTVTGPSLWIEKEPAQDFYALVGSTKNVDGQAIKLKAVPQCYAAGGIYRWSAVNAAGEATGEFVKFRADDPSGENCDPLNNSAQAQEVIFRATEPGLMKVTVTYTPPGQAAVSSAPVEFKAYDGRLELYWDPDPPFVWWDDVITFWTRFKGDPGTPDDLLDDKDWGIRPVTWFVSDPLGDEWESPNTQTHVELTGDEAGIYWVWADITINPTWGTVGKKSAISKLELKSVEFTTDHGVLTKKPPQGTSEWAECTTPFESPEWQKDPPRTNPISHTKASKVGAKVRLRVEPAETSFGLVGSAQAHQYVSFSKFGNVALGTTDQDIAVEANAALPDQVGTLTPLKVFWYITSKGVSYAAGISAGHTIYVTYGTPAAVVPADVEQAFTERRMRWACDNAAGATDISGVADKIHSALAGDPPYDPPSGKPKGKGWPLMAGDTQGACDRQAQLMQFGLGILGIRSGRQYVRPSLDAGKGKCLNVERNVKPDGTIWWLIFQIAGTAPGTPLSPNAYEACCVLDLNDDGLEDLYYAVWPKYKEPDDYEVLKKLLYEKGWAQVWVRTENDVEPGEVCVIEDVDWVAGYPQPQ